MHLETTKIAMNHGVVPRKTLLTINTLTDLPYGKDLYEDDLSKALEIIFDEYCTDIVIAKLSPG